MALLVKETPHDTVTGSFQKLSAGEETISDSKGQSFRLSCTLHEELNFHKMTPKLTEFLHRTSYFNTQVKMPEQRTSERQQKKIRKSSKDVNPITAFKWQGTLSPSLYFTVSLPSAHCHWQEQPEGPVALATGVLAGDHRSGAGRWVRISLCGLSHCAWRDHGAVPPGNYSKAHGK